MWKSFVIFFFFALTTSLSLSSCVGPKDDDSPAHTIVNSYTALSQQDSVGYLETLAREKREVYEALPAAAHSLLREWKGNRPEITVLSVKRSNGTATVLYDLKVRGRNPEEQDSLLAHTDLEEGGWKLGY